jgi:aspartate racemase
MNHIGILAHSADGASLCFLEIVRESGRRLGEHLHPEVTMSILPMGGEVFAAYLRDDKDAVNATLTKSASRLASAGCDFFVCPDNTAHIILDAAKSEYPLPGLHIVRIVAERAVEMGYKKIALLGTNWTMTGPAYPTAFADFGLDLLSPDEEDRQYIDGVIFDELCQGIVSDTSRKRFVEIIAKLKDKGCDAVALSCTEIPLLITPEVSPLPTLDSTRLLAHAAVDVALGSRLMPEWRGGKYSNVVGVS